MLVRPDGSGLNRVMRTEGGTWLSDGRRMLTSDSGNCHRAGIVEIDIERGTFKQLTNRCRIAGTGDPTISEERASATFSTAWEATTASPAAAATTIFSGDPETILCSHATVVPITSTAGGRDSVVADRIDRVSRSCERQQASQIRL